MVSIIFIFSLGGGYFLFKIVKKIFYLANKFIDI